MSSVASVNVLPCFWIGGVRLDTWGYEFNASVKLENVAVRKRIVLLTQHMAR